MKRPSLSSLADLPTPHSLENCSRQSVRYFSKTGDEKHLLSLPLEQRQLLEDVLPPGEGVGAGRA